VISSKDKALLKVMEDSLEKYLKAAGLISQDAFDIMSEHNGLLWSEISTQRDILKELHDIDVIDQPDQKGKDHIDKQDVISHETKKEDVKNQDNDLQVKKDGPVSLYNKVVKFLKKQKCDELKWVRTYTFSCNYEDYEDFQIKYFEHKDPVQSKKNYIMFGNTRKSFSIRKSGEDIVGDTSECFEIILDLAEIFKGD